MIEASPRLKIIARHGVGTDNVDISAASENGVWVTSTPGSNSNAVAEHVFALLLSLTRQIVPAAEPCPGGNVGGRPRRPGRFRTLRADHWGRRLRSHRQARCRHRPGLRHARPRVRPDRQGHGRGGCRSGPGRTGHSSMPVRTSSLCTPHYCPTPGT